MLWRVCAASFQLIRVIPKWLLASMEMGVKGMKYMSAAKPRQQNIMN